jgi:eukaryotic-like serine/threonine-protein kinase
MLEKRIGKGGFGSVWRALDQETGIKVAIKVLHPDISASPDEMDSIRLNFNLVSRLTHPGICTLRYLHKIDSIDLRARENLNVGKDDYLIVMDLIEGVTLTQYRRSRGGRLSVAEVVSLGRQIAEALDYAHNQRIIHRDIKPSNIMITNNRDGKCDIKILDFGLAAEIRNSLSRVSRDMGDTSGTRPYMAPEQWAGRRQDARSDQYSLAVLLYELIAGEVPFASAFASGDTILMMQVVCNHKPEKPDGITDAQNRVLLKALMKDKADRFSTCSEFVEALDTVAKKDVRAEVPDTKPEKVAQSIESKPKPTPERTPGPKTVSPPVEKKVEHQPITKNDQSTRFSRLAVASFVCSLCFFVSTFFNRIFISIIVLPVSSIPAIICGHIAISRIKKQSDILRGKRLAIAGLVLGYLPILSIAVAVAVAVIEHLF